MEKVLQHILVTFFIAFVQQPIFAIREIGSACDPVKDDCGKNAVCFRMPRCQMGVCLCRSPIYKQLWYRRTDCGRVLDEGAICMEVDPGLLPAGSICSYAGRVKCVQRLWVSISITTVTLLTFLCIGSRWCLFTRQFTNGRFR